MLRVLKNIRELNVIENSVDIALSPSFISARFIQYWTNSIDMSEARIIGDTSSDKYFKWLKLLEIQTSDLEDWLNDGWLESAAGWLVTGCFLLVKYFTPLRL